MRLHAVGCADNFARESLFQIADVRGVAGQGAGGEDVNSGRFECVRDVVGASDGEGEAIADMGITTRPGLHVFLCHSCRPNESIRLTLNLGA